MAHSYITIHPPDGWSFERKDRTLSNDGDRVECVHEADGLTVWIEGVIDESVGPSADALGFWGVLRTDEEPIEGPVQFTATSYGSTDAARTAAVEWLKETMDAYS